MQITDHQIRLLKIVDCVRWGEEEKLDLYQYHLLRRAIGEQDPVVTFELEQAASFRVANPEIRSGPEEPYERSPWIKTWLNDPAASQ